MSYRERAEAFARRLQSRLRTLGLHDHHDNEELHHDVREQSENTWPGTELRSGEQSHEPLENNEAVDAFYDFDLEPDSPGSPADDLEYHETESDSLTQISNGNSSDIKVNEPESSKSTSSTFFDCIGDQILQTKIQNNTSLNNKLIPNGHIQTNNCTHQDAPVLQTEENIETDLNDNNIGFNKKSSSPVKETSEDVVDKGIVVIIDQAPTKVDEEILPRKQDVNRLTSITETDEEEDFVDDKPSRLRRCSSLKSGKTPPGTPGRKKTFRFADELGLDLADVKTFLDHEVPKIPKSAYEDLEVRDHIIPQIPQFIKPVDKILVPLFQQPGGLPCFLNMVRAKQVCLENCAVTDPISLTITGSVRVRNLDFHKSVYIRYTLDNWKSFSDIQANYVENSCDGFSDKFTFTLFGNSLQIGQRIEIAVRFHCKGQQYWDSNCDSNYCFQCLPLNQQPKPQVKQDLPPITNECSGAFY